MRQSIVCKVCGSGFSEHWQLFEHATCQRPMPAEAPETPIVHDSVSDRSAMSPGPPEENAERDLRVQEEGRKLAQLMTDLRGLERPRRQEPPPETEEQA